MVRLFFLIVDAMKFISSKDNPRFKHWLKVSQAKVKHEVLLEGTHLCEMWFAQYGLPEQVIIREDVVQSATGAGDRQLQALLKQLGAEQLLVLPDNLFQALNSVPSPQGILFHCKVPYSHEITIPTNTSIYLERIQDPGNLGTIIRTCAAADVEAIYLSPACVNPWSSKVLRSAQGAHFSVKIYTHVEPADLFTQNTLPVYATYLSAGASNLYKTSLPQQLIWLLGNEGQGISDELIRYADEQIFIPQSNKVESLNVGIACGLVLFEQRRQWLG